VNRRSVALAFVIVVPIPHIAIGQVQRAVVARDGQAVVGGGTIRNMAGITNTISASGAVAMEGAAIDSLGVVTGGILYLDAGLVHLLTAPGPVGGGFGEGDPQVARDGIVIFGATLPLTQVPPPGVVDDHDYAIVAGSPAGRVVLAREGDRAPATPDGVIFTGRRELDDGQLELKPGFNSFHLALPVRNPVTNGSLIRGSCGAVNWRSKKPSQVVSRCSRRYQSSAHASCTTAR
jgi:hypothetical protein